MINGGDGPGEHPSQALLDLYTIQREFSRLGKIVDGAHIALRYDESGKIVTEGMGPTVVEYLRCGRWEWEPVSLVVVRARLLRELINSR